MSVAAAAARSAGRTRLARIGLGTPAARAWAVYDAGSTAVSDVVVTAVFPIYFSSVVAADLPRAAATERFALVTACALAVVAAIAPWLGRVADVTGSRKRWFSGFLVAGAGSVALLSLTGPGAAALASALFAATTVALSGTAVFRDALLPHVVDREDLDRTSTASYALGYLGGALALAAVATAIERPAWLGLGTRPGLDGGSLPVRASFVAVAAWWILLSVPLLRRVREPPGRPWRGGARPLAARLREELAILAAHPSAARFLLAFLLYSAGTGTVLRMAVVYGAEIGIDAGGMLVTVIVVDLVGVPFALLFAGVAGRLGARRAILAGLGVYVVAVIAASRITTAGQFFGVALLVAAVQGGTLALSRSLFAALVPRERAAQGFGFYALANQVAGACGPAAFAATAAITGSSRLAVLSTAGLLVAGGVVLARVPEAVTSPTASGRHGRRSPAGRGGGAKPAGGADRGDSVR